MVGSSGASCPPGRAGVPPRRPDRHPFLHRRIRHRQGAHQLPRGRPLGSARTEARAGGGLDRRGARALPADVGAELGLGPLRERASRREPGPDVVDDRHHEDRPRRAASGAASRWASTSSPATSRWRGRAGHGLHRRRLRPAAAALLPRRRLRRASGSLLSALVDTRDARPRPARGDADGGAARAVVSTQREVFARTTWRRPRPVAVSQAGLVNNLNDGMAWGLFPLLFASAGLGLAEIGVARRDLSRRSGARASSSRGRSPIVSGGSG